MPSSFKALPLVVAATLLGACAGMSEQACLVSDWQTIGFEDGAAGRPVGSIGRYRQACSKHGVAPDLAAYRIGHDAGVEIYCRPGQGFETGRRGAIYAGVCPADLEQDFLAAYGSGRQLFELETALRNVDNRIAANEREQASIKHELTEIAAAMVAEDVSTEERVKLVARTAELGMRHGELGNETEGLKSERVIHERALLDYRETLAFGF